MRGVYVLKSAENGGIVSGGFLVCNCASQCRFDPHLEEPATNTYLSPTPLPL